MIMASKKGKRYEVWIGSGIPAQLRDRRFPRSHTQNRDTVPDCSDNRRPVGDVTGSVAGRQALASSGLNAQCAQGRLALH